MLFRLSAPAQESPSSSSISSGLMGVFETDLVTLSRVASGYTSVHVPPAELRAIVLASVYDSKLRVILLHTTRESSLNHISLHQRARDPAFERGEWSTVLSHVSLGPFQVVAPMLARMTAFESRSLATALRLTGFMH